MNGLSLAQLQRQFLARLRGHAADELLPCIAEGRLARDTGLGIYEHAYGARLCEALDNDHKLLGAYLGDELWQRLCAGYIAAHPSRHRSLRHFGDDLPRYLAEAEPYRAHPEIAELAMLERRLLDSFDAADGERADWQGLQVTPPAQWPGLRLRFHPSLMLHRVAMNSVEIWRALKNQKPPPGATAATSVDWALWRDAERVTRFRSLDAEECQALQHFLRGGDFAGLCDLLLAWHPMEAVPAAALSHLQCWCAEGWVARWAVAD